MKTQKTGALRGQMAERKKKPATVRRSSPMMTVNRSRATLALSRLAQRSACHIPFGHSASR